MLRARTAAAVAGHLKGTCAKPFAQPSPALCTLHLVTLYLPSCVVIVAGEGAQGLQR